MGHGDQIQLFQSRVSATHRGAGGNGREFGPLSSLRVDAGRSGLPRCPVQLRESRVRSACRCGYFGGWALCEVPFMRESIARPRRSAKAVGDATSFSLLNSGINRETKLCSRFFKFNALRTACIGLGRGRGFLGVCVARASSSYSSRVAATPEPNCR